MKNIKELLVQGGDKWLEIALSCKKAKSSSLPELAEDIKDKCDDYFSVIRSTECNPPESIFENNDKIHLKHDYIDLYNNPPAKLKKLLISKRRDHSLISCPYCGNPTIPDTLDHFIPKDLLAEFSIFPNNLIPQCRTCAPIKGSKYYSQENNMAMFTHPLDSELLNNVVVKIIPNLVDSNFTFDVKFSTSATDDKDKLALTLHIRSLKIKERILSYCNKEVRKWIRKLKRSEFDIEFVLTARLAEYEVNDRRSNWEFVLYDALLNHEPSMRFLKSIQVKDKQDVQESEILEELDI